MFLETKINRDKYLFSKPDRQLVEIVAGHLLVNIDAVSFDSVNGYVRERPHVLPSITSA
jgi:hypothetical protein